MTKSTLHDRASQRNNLQIIPLARPRIERAVDCDGVPARKAEFPTHEQALRAALAWVRARHDSGALSPGVFTVLKMIEVEIAWRQHRQHRGEVAP